MKQTACTFACTIRQRAKNLALIPTLDVSSLLRL